RPCGATGRSSAGSSVVARWRRSPGTWGATCRCARRRRAPARGAWRGTRTACPTRSCRGASTYALASRRSCWSDTSPCRSPRPSGAPGQGEGWAGVLGTARRWIVRDRQVEVIVVVAVVVGGEQLAEELGRGQIAGDAVQHRSVRRARSVAGEVLFDAEGRVDRRQIVHVDGEPPRVAARSTGAGGAQHVGSGEARANHPVPPEDRPDLVQGDGEATVQEQRAPIASLVLDASER